jgi:Cu(I)/Ag(I) efflux system membrane fusion protein
MAPTDADPAPGVGELLVLDRRSRTATIEHEPIEALDWPALTTRFAVAADVPLEDLEPEVRVRFEAVRGADGRLALTNLRPDDGVDAVGSGTIHAVMAADGKVTVSHDPIEALDWPAMTMDLPIADTVDPGTIPLETPVAFDLTRGEGAMYVITAVRPHRATGHAGGEDMMPPDGADPAADDPPAITAGGIVNAIDAEARTANISHDDIAEIGMPGMTMNFPLDEALDPDQVAVGQRVLIGFRRSGGMQLEVVSVRPEAGGSGQ